MIGFPYTFPFSFRLATLETIALTSMICQARSADSKCNQSIELSGVFNGS